MQVQTPSSLLFTEFSNCSIREYGKWLISNWDNAKCLENYPMDIYGPTCGDGFVSPGEDCDCGSNISCANIDPCCDVNCRFTIGSECSSIDSCCRNCSIVTNTNVLCREPFNRDCDLPEYCDGVSSVCPLNKVQKLGTPCSNGRCISGKCQYNYSQQCYDLNNAPFFDIRSKPYLPCSLVNFSSSFFCKELKCGIKGDSKTCTYFQLFDAHVNTRAGTPCSENGDVCYNEECIQVPHPTITCKWITSHIQAPVCTDITGSLLSDEECPGIKTHQCRIIKENNASVLKIFLFFCIVLLF